MSNMLKKLRVMRGEKMVEVAAKIGISKQRYHNFEKNGIGSSRDEEIIRKIAEHFGVSPFELLGSDNLKIKPRDDKEAILAKRYAFRNNDIKPDGKENG